MDRCIGANRSRRVCQSVPIHWIVSGFLDRTGNGAAVAYRTVGLGLYIGSPGRLVLFAGSNQALAVDLRYFCYLGSGNCISNGSPVDFPSFGAWSGARSAVDAPFALDGSFQSTHSGGSYQPQLATGSNAAWRFDRNAARCCSWQHLADGHAPHFGLGQMTRDNTR